MTTATCVKQGCALPAKSRGFCESHYRYRLHTGRYGYQDASDVRAHLSRLRQLGWTWTQIGDAASVSSSIPYHLLTGRRYRRVLPETRDALLAIPAVPALSMRGVDSAGTRRRVQALAWMGWPCAEVARRAGTTGRSLATLILPTRRVSYALAAKVAAVYDELSGVRGPSNIAAAKARGMGFAPPAAWDEDTIDDPDSVPCLGHEAVPGLDLAEVDHLEQGGCHLSEIARRMGVSVGYIQRRRSEVSREAA